VSVAPSFITEVDTALISPQWGEWDGSCSPDCIS